MPQSSSGSPERHRTGRGPGSAHRLRPPRSGARCRGPTRWSRGRYGRARPRPRAVPGPRRPTSRTAPAGVAVSRHRERGALGRVRDDVLEQRVHGGGRGPRPTPAPSSGPSGRRTVTARAWSSARADQNSTRSPTTAVASQDGIRPSRCGRRAAWITAVSIRSSALTCEPTRSASSGSRSASASRRSAVSGVRSRCERSATVSRSSAISSSMRSASRLRARRPPRPRAGRRWGRVP